MADRQGSADVPKAHHKWTHMSADEIQRTAGIPTSEDPCTRWLELTILVSHVLFNLQVHKQGFSY
jgi:hypothetical protein